MNRLLLALLLPVLLLLAGCLALNRVLPRPNAPRVPLPEPSEERPSAAMATTTLAQKADIDSEAAPSAFVIPLAAVFASWYAHKAARSRSRA